MTGTKLPLGNIIAFQDPPPTKIWIITYKDEAALWSRSNHLMENRLLPSSDDSDDNFCSTLEEKVLK
jgi:hypothetical protein